MPWGDNGTTNLREAQDQAPTWSWGSQQVSVNFNPINDVGYLRRLWLKFPYSQQTITLAATADPLAVPAEQQYVPHRGINSFSLIAQGIAPIYQLSKGGLDLAALSYFKSGRKETTGSIIATESNAVTNTHAYGHTTDKWAYRMGAAVGSTGGATQTVTYADTLDVPITECVYYPGGQVAGASGSSSIALPQWAEVGLLTAQNTQQNLRLSVLLNPMWQVSGGTYDTVFTATTAVPTSTYSGTMQVWSEFYDVPASPADAPPAFTQAYIVTRQTRDWPVSAQQVFPKHEAAGLLLRSIYLFFDVNDQLIDISGQATDPTFGFRWGANIYKENTIPFEQLSAEIAESMGDPLPAGMCAFDFFGIDGPFKNTLTNAINTVKLGAVYSEIKNLPAAVTTCHVIEERLVPVKG